MKENLKQSALSAKDKEALMQMGAFLGYLDKDMQLRTVELYLEELDREIQTAGESIPGKQRLCRSLGILGGLFLVLLLISNRVRRAVQEGRNLWKSALFLKLPQLASWCQC